MNNFVYFLFIIFVYSILGKATKAAAKAAVTSPKLKRPQLNKQFSTMSIHSHRLSLARSESSEEELDEHEKPYDAPLTRIFALNKPEWLYNLIGNLSLMRIISSNLIASVES